MMNPQNIELDWSGAICDEDSRREVLSRAAQTMAALARLKTIWKDKNIQNKTNAHPVLVITIFLYMSNSQKVVPKM